MRKAILLLLLGLGLLWGQETDRKARLYGGLSGPKVIAQNDRIVAAVGNDGRFTIGTRCGKPLLYGFSREGATSHTHFYVNGNIYGTYSEGVGLPPAPDMVMLPSLVDGSVVCKWLIDSVLVTQKITPTFIGTEGKIFMEYFFENISRRPHRVGLLLFLDTKIGSNDYAPIATEYGYFSVEREFIAPVIPEFWQAYESSPFQPPDSLVGEGILSGSGATPPDRFVYGDYWNYRAVEWDYEFVGGPYSDSSLLLRWNALFIAPGETRYISTYYGEGNVSATGGSLALSIASPTEVLPFNCDELTPNPFNLNIIVANNSPDTARGVVCNIVLPDGLSLVSGSLIESTEPPTLAPLTNGTRSWQIMIDEMPLRDTTYTIDVLVTARDMATFEVSRTISVSASDLTPPEITLIAPAEYSVIANADIDFKFLITDDSEVNLDLMLIEFGEDYFGIDDTEVISLLGDTVIFSISEHTLADVSDEFRVSISGVEDEFACRSLRTEFFFVNDNSPPTITLESPSYGDTIYSERYGIRLALMDDYSPIIGDSIAVVVNSEIVLDISSEGVDFDGNILTVQSYAFDDGFPTEYDLRLCISNVMDYPDIGNPNISPEMCYDFYYNGSSPVISLIEPDLEGFLSCDTIEGVIGINHPAGIIDESIQVYVGDSLIGGIHSPWISYVDGFLSFSIPIESYGADSVIIGVVAETRGGITSPLIDWVCYIDREPPEIMPLTPEITNPEQEVRFLITDSKSGVNSSSLVIEAENLHGHFTMDAIFDTDTAIISLSSIPVSGCDDITFYITVADNSNICGNNIAEFSYTLTTPCTPPNIEAIDIFSEYLCGDGHVLRYLLTDDEGVSIDDVSVSVGGTVFTILDDELSFRNDTLYFTPVSIADGEFVVLLSGVEDIFGNLSPEHRGAIRFDNSPPVLLEISPSPEIVLRGREIAFNMRFGDEHSGIDHMRSELALPDFGVVRPIYSDEVSFDLSEFAVGDIDEFRVCFTLYDNSVGCGGNLLDSCLTYNIDLNSPAIDILMPTPGVIYGCHGPFEISIVDEDGVDLSSISVVFDGIAYSYDSPEVVFEGDILTFSPSSIPEGRPVNLAVVVSDMLGNESDAFWSFTFDFTPPVATLISPTQESTIYDFLPEIRILITDDFAGVDFETIELTINDHIFTTASEEIDMRVDTLVYTPSGNMLGENTVRIRLFDRAEVCPNVAEESFAFYIVPEPLTIRTQNPYSQLHTGCETVEFSFEIATPDEIILDEAIVLLNGEIHEVSFDYIGDVIAFELSGTNLNQGENLIRVTSLSDMFGNIYPDTVSYTVFYDSEAPAISYISHDSGTEVFEVCTISLVFHDISGINAETIDVTANVSEIDYVWLDDTLTVAFRDHNLDTAVIYISVFDGVEYCPNQKQITLKYPLIHPEFFIIPVEPLPGTISHISNQRVVVNARGRDMETAMLRANGNLPITADELDWDPVSEQFTFAPGTGVWREGENVIEFSVDGLSHSWSFFMDNTPPEVISISPENGAYLRDIPQFILIEVIDDISGVEVETVELSVDGLMIDNSILEFQNNLIRIPYPESDREYEPGDSVFIKIIYLEDKMPDYGVPNYIDEEIVFYYIFSGPGWTVSEQYIITPNGDGINDELIIKTAKNSDLKVYDLSGREIYSVSGSGELIWDGRSQSGRDMPPGLYIYSLEESGKFLTKGTIVIAR